VGTFSLYSCGLAPACPFDDIAGSLAVVVVFSEFSAQIILNSFGPLRESTFAILFGSSQVPCHSEKFIHQKFSVILDSHERCPASELRKGSHSLD